ncbi:MAG: hypothetical protein GY785_26260 [Gammaproteobacteria bacterium]|nr:hypothetical protein [Gammaproteobacteria bacterium]MCP4981372.1 hypothetical protein [Gammaproteobacteria bacterium]
MNEEIEAEARNLLLNCTGAKVGDRLLLVGEQAALPYFDSQLCNDVAEEAERLGSPFATIDYSMMHSATIIFSIKSKGQRHTLLSRPMGSR